MTDLTVGLLLFPNMTELDLTGPLQVVRGRQAGLTGPDHDARQDAHA